MTSWIIAIIVAMLSLGYGALAGMANMMSDAPAGEKSPMWPVVVGLLIAVAIVVAHKFIG